MTVYRDDLPTGSTLRVTLRLLGEHPWRTVVVVGLSLLSGLAEGVSIVSLLPMLGVAGGAEVETLPEIAETVETALRAFGLELTVPVLLGVIAIGMVVKAVLKILALWQAGAATAQVAADLRLRLIQRLMEVRWGYFVRLPSGQITNAISSEAERSSRVFLGAINLISTGIQLLVYVGIAVLVSWQVALVALMSGALMVWALSGLVRSSRRAGEQQTTLLKSLISRLTDTLYAIKPLKAMGREDSMTPLFEEETRDINVAQRREAATKAALGSFHEPIITLFVCLLIYVLLVLRGVPFSEILFMAFVLYRTVLNVGVAQKYYQGIGIAQSALVSLRHAIERAAESAEDLTTGIAPPSLEKGIRFEDVSFAYDKQPVLEGFDAFLPAKQVTAVVGPSGVGKTTMADLVAVLYEPDAGSIYVDDVPLADIDIREWRRRIGYVPQDSVLFHDTIVSNLWLSEGEPDYVAAEEALRAAEAWDFVSELPDGLETIVGEHGLRLSGGQRQRLAVARALLHGPELLILDEATTALDPDTEREILSTVAGLRDRITILAISHQPAVMDIADNVIRLSVESAPVMTATKGRDLRARRPN